MVSLCIRWFLLVRSVHATSMGNSTSCKTPAVGESIQMIQRYAGRVPRTSQSKVSRAHDVTLPMRSAEQEVFALHIGKTGMTSLCLENRNFFAPAGKFRMENKCAGYATKEPYARSHIQEACLPLLHHEGAFHITLLREPRAWAVSAFTHCIGVSKDPFFKTLEYNNWSEPAFLKWLEHFGNDRWGDRNGVDDPISLRDSWRAGDTPDLLANRSLHCYNPRNFQSEALTCQSNGTFHHAPTSRPSRKAVKNSLQKQLQFVGVAELYDESACLLHYQLNATLLPWCSCDYFGAKKPSEEKLLEWHPDERIADHPMAGRPHHPDVTTLSTDTLQAIDDITDVDRDMYMVTLKLFLMRLRKLEKMHDTQLICPAQMLKLQEKLSYLDVQGLLSTIMNA